MRVFPLIALLAGCAGSGREVVFLVEYQDLIAALDDDTPSRAWEIRIEADASAMRDGETRATMRVEGVATVVESEGFEPVTVDAVLTGGASDADQIFYPTPGRGNIDLLDHLDVACALGEGCVWSYALTVVRTRGVGEVALELQSRGLLTLGYGNDAPSDAFMRVVIEEVELDDTGDTGM